MHGPKMNQQFLEQVLAATISDGGVTADWHHQVILVADDYWYFPAWPEHTVITDRQELREALTIFVQKHDVLLHQVHTFLGTWLNPENKQYYLDINTRRTDKQEALDVAQKHSQRSGRQIVSIYNPLLDQTVYL